VLAKTQRRPAHRYVRGVLSCAGGQAGRMCSACGPF
jgi:hypothetical protein